MGGRKLPVVVLALVSLGLSGCPLIWLGAGAAGGYAISKDSVRNQFDLPKETIYRESLAVAREMGLVTLEDPSHGRIQLRVENANVTITIKPMTQRAVELKVRARNQFLMPEIEIAQALYNKIIARL